MYNSYTSLQREQLAKQTYTDTQSTYLLVYAPLRSRVLAQALQDQLHRKFRLVDHLAGELTDAVAGVLLVSEDVACLSTTLTYFAQALRDGADYAVCNAVFGFSGQTALYQSHGHLAENKFALVSRSLLARCRAAARDPESVTELLALNIYSTYNINKNWHGVAQAKAVVFFILVAVLAIAQQAATRSKEVQQ